MSSPGNNENNAARDIYQDPKLEQSQANDPVYDLIAANWRPFATTLIAILVAIYFVQSFRESYESSMQASADIFTRLQKHFDEYQQLTRELRQLEKAKPADGSVKSQEAKTADAAKADQADGENQAKLDELSRKAAESRSQIEQLITSASDSREPYKSLALLYKGYFNRQNAPGLAMDMLRPLSDFKEAGGPGSAEQLTAELAAVETAKLELESENTRQAAFDKLKALSQSGSYTAVYAAKILLESANTEAEKKEAKESAERLLQKHPEQAELLKDSLAGY